MRATLLITFIPVISASCVTTCHTILRQVQYNWNLLLSIRNDVRSLIPPSSPPLPLPPYLPPSPYSPPFPPHSPPSLPPMSFQNASILVNYWFLLVFGILCFLFLCMITRIILEWKKIKNLGKNEGMKHEIV
jgi:hypothetical protein